MVHPNVHTTQREAKNHIKSVFHFTSEGKLSEETSEDRKIIITYEKTTEYISHGC